MITSPYMEVIVSAIHSSNNSLACACHYKYRMYFICNLFILSVALVIFIHWYACQTRVVLVTVRVVLRTFLCVDY